MLEITKINEKENERNSKLDNFSIHNTYLNSMLV